MNIYIPVCRVMERSGEVTEQVIFSAGMPTSAFQSKTDAESHFGMFFDVWHDTYADIDKILLSLSVREFQAI